YGVVNSLLGQQQAGQQGPQAFGNLGVPRGVGGQGAAPVGSVTTSPLGPPSLNPSVVSLLNSLLANRGSSSPTPAAPANNVTQQLLAQTMGNQLGGQNPGGQANMGFPSAGLGVNGLGQYGQFAVSPGQTLGT